MFPLIKEILTFLPVAVSIFFRLSQLLKQTDVKNDYGHILLLFAVKIFVFSAARVTRQTLSRVDSGAAGTAFFDWLMVVSTKLSLSDSLCLIWSPVSVPLCTSVRFSNMLFDGNFEACFFLSLCGHKKKNTLRGAHTCMTHQDKCVGKVCVKQTLR